MRAVAGTAGSGAAWLRTGSLVVVFLGAVTLLSPAFVGERWASRAVQLAEAAR